MKSTQELLVFIASPGDCDEERKRVRDVAEAINNGMGADLGVRIRTAGWEYVSPDLGRPQDRINPLVDECDLFVGILGHRWGTPTGTHSSGFLEEWERVVDRRGGGETPLVALYFRAVPPDRAADPGAQLSEVIRFRERVESQRLALHGGTFAEPNDFELKIWKLLSALVVSSARQEELPTSSSGSTAQPETRLDDGEQRDGADAVGQLTALTADLQGVVLDRQEASSLDVDRLLLVSLALNRDGGHLPVHVANRLFRRRADLLLSEAEKRMWLRSLLADIGRSSGRADRFIPGWGAVAPTDEDLGIALFTGDATVTAGVLAVLERRRMRSPYLWDVDNEEAAERWRIVLDKGGLAAGAAVQYLVAMTTGDDVALVRAIGESTGNADINEYAHVLAGQPADLLSGIAGSSGYSLPDWKRSLALQHMRSGPSEVLKAVALRRYGDSEVRSCALRELHARGEVDSEVVDALMGDRAVVDNLLDLAFDKSTAIKPEDVIAALGKLEADERPTGVLERAVALVSDPADLMSTYQENPGASTWRSICWQGDPEAVELARDVYDTDAEAIARSLGREPSVDDHLLDFVRGEARRSALRLLANQEAIESEDLERIRQEVRRDDRYAAGVATGLLARYGTVQDVELIAARLERTFATERREAVDVLLTRHGKEAAKRLEPVASDAELAAIVTVLGADPEVPDSDIVPYLTSESDVARIAAVDALRSRLPTEALGQLLDRYMSQERYFYNVVVELDWCAAVETAGALST